jgi:multiple sugar transport system substrate-binding protein
MATKPLNWTILLIALLGGCRSHGPGKTSGVEELTFWNGFSGPDGKAMEKIVSRFNQEHPRIHVKMQIIPWGTYYDKLTLSLAYGGAPDVFIVHEARVAEYASHGALTPMDSVPGTDMSDFVPSVKQVGLWQGERFGLPLDCHPLGLYYNLDLFREAGIDHPPTNLAEFVEDGKKLTKPGQWGTAMTDIHLVGSTLLYQFGAGLLNPTFTQSTLSSPQSAEAVNTLLSFSDKYRISPPPQGNDAWMGFQMGKVGMVFQGTWMIDSLDHQKNLHYAAAPVPFFGPTKAVWAGSHTLCIPAAEPEDRRRAGLTFISYLSSHSLDWARGGQVPVRLSILNSPEFQQLRVMREFAKELPYIHYEPFAVTANQVEPFADEAIDASLNHIDQPATLLKAASDRIDNVLRRQ